MYRDSMVALAYIKDPKYHQQTKHIGIKYNFIRDTIEEVQLEYISTKHIVVDPLTKTILPNVFANHVKAMDLRRMQKLLALSQELYIDKILERFNM